MPRSDPTPARASSAPAPVRASTEPSVGVVTVAGSAEGFAATLRSLQDQDDGRWEWVVAVLGPAALRGELAAIAAGDPRVRVIDGAADLIGGLNAALRAARARHICLLLPGDRLECTAVGIVGGMLDEGGWLYTDEAWSFDGDDGDRDWRKPGYGPELLRSQPYAVRSAMLPRSVALELGGVRPDAGSAYWYDLVLRVAERCGDPQHLAGPFYLRAPVADPPAPPWLDGDPDDRCRAVADHCARIGLTVRRVEPVAVRGNDLGQRAVRQRPGGRSVSVVIPTRGATSPVYGVPRCHVLELVRQLRAGDGATDVEIVVVHDADTPPGVVAALAAIGEPVRLIPFAGPFNFSRKCNIGALAAAGEFLCFLNDDVEVIAPDWLDGLVALAGEPGVGAVGPKLLFADGTLQHAGHRLTVDGIGHMLFRCAADSVELAGIGQLCGERSGVTAACMVVPAAVFTEVGGFWEDLPLNYNDVDLCQKIRAAGYRIVYNPDAVLYHFESQSREFSVTAAELSAVRRRWDYQLRHDPYVNPLSAHDPDPSDA